MTHDPRWEKINALFDGALERPGAERAAFLDAACEGDTALRAEVERLLAAHLRAGDFIETPAIEAMSGAASPFEGQVIGPWRILREIGRGGMGTVHLAERADGQFDQQIALKLIRRGMDTESVLRRFRTERQILAHLDHPHIARLYDGGTTEGGLPYFAMEYIEGDPIDRWCDARKFTVTQRLDLFRQVCAAVAFAHQNLVVHRDIKPSNVLVGADGRARLLDFGIARILSEDDEAGEARTATGMLLMTPEYASPEQVRGERATTLSDVYSLGVMLYGLLCGRAPHTFTARSYAEILRVLDRADPERPSVALAAPGGMDAAGHATPAGAADVSAARGVTTERLKRQLAGDLDTIVLKALHRDPQRRYASAEQLSEDIRRHLAGLPVGARPDTAGYRMRKFIRRNRSAAVAAALVVVSLVAGVAATTWQAARARESQGRAERRFADLRRLARSVLFDYHDAIKDLPGATPIRERLVADGLEYLDGLASDAGHDPSLQRELAAAYDRLADVQGGTLFANLGNTAGALDSYAKAQRIHEALMAADSADAQNRRGYASNLVKRAKLLWETGELGQALVNTGRAIRILESLVAEAPDDEDMHRQLFVALDTDAMLRLDTGDAHGAAAQERRQLALATELAARDPANANTRRALSVANDHLGSALLAMGDAEGALEHNRVALAQRAALAEEYPLNADYRRALAVSYYNDGEILARLGRAREASESYRKDVRIVEDLSRADPKNEQYRGDRAYGYIRIGDMQALLGDVQDAEASYRGSLALREEDVKADPSNHWKRASLIEAHAKMAKVQARLGASEAVAHTSEALRLMNMTTLEPTDVQLRSFFALTYSDLGEACMTLASSKSRSASARRTQWERALELTRQSAAIWKDLGDRGILLESDAAQPGLVAAQLARCEAGLAGPTPER